MHDVKKCAMNFKIYTADVKSNNKIRGMCESRAAVEPRFSTHSGRLALVRGK